MTNLLRLRYISSLSLLMASLSQPSLANDQTVDYLSLDPASTAAYAIETLGLKSVALDDNSLMASQRIVSFGENGSQIRFKRPATMAEDGEFQAQIEAIKIDRDDFLTWTTANTAATVADLSPLLEKLISGQVTFIGPIMQNNGESYQLFFQLPESGYIEVIGSTISKAEHQSMPRNWAQIWDQMDTYGVSSIPTRLSSLGGSDGRMFDSVVESRPDETMTKITFYYEGYLRGMHIEYKTGASLSYGSTTDTVYTFDIPDDETITKAVACKFKPEGSDGDRLSFIHLSTESSDINFGYTETETSCQSLLPHKNHTVLGFYGRQGSDIHSLGLITRPLSGELLETTDGDLLYSDKVGENSGVTFDTVALNQNAKIKKIDFYYDNYLHGMVIDYENNTRLRFGTTKGTKRTIELSYNEHLISILTCRIQPNQSESSRVGFMHITSTSRELSFGTAQNESDCKPFVPENEKSFIGGFHGSQGEDITSLGVIFKRSDATVSF